MKTITFLTLITIFAGCQAQPAPVTAEFKRAVEIVSTEAIFSSSFSTMMQRLKGLCTAGKKLENGTENVSCTQKTGISKIDFRGTADPTIISIDTTFIGLEKCAFVKQLATKKYGKPSSDKGPCEAAWSLTPVKNGPERHLTLSPKTAKNTAVLIIAQDDEWQ